jgi:hypothetical protein
MSKISTRYDRTNQNYWTPSQDGKVYKDDVQTPPILAL